MFQLQVRHLSGMPIALCGDAQRSASHTGKVMSAFAAPVDVPAAGALWRKARGILKVGGGISTAAASALTATAAVAPRVAALLDGARAARNATESAAAIAAINPNKEVGRPAPRWSMAHAQMSIIFMRACNKPDLPGHVPPVAAMMTAAVHPDGLLQHGRCHSHSHFHSHY